MVHRVAVIGAGSWGTAVASLIARNTPTTLWARSDDLAARMNRSRSNERYLPSVVLPDGLTATSSLQEALLGATIVLVAVPSHGVRKVLNLASPHLAANPAVFSLIKGVEQGSFLTISQILTEIVPGVIAGVVTGPNLAAEVAQGLPAACVVACDDPVAATSVQEVLHSPTLRAYTSSDVIGCEIAGATKNVIAIAAGIVDGMEMGQNARAALMSRGLAEMSRLCVALGGLANTVNGLAGVGDLIVTCTSPESRNRQVGIGLGQGRSLNEIVESMHMVAEGVKSAGPLTERAKQAGVEMPICEQVSHLITGMTTPTHALATLMDRPRGAE